jgi:TPR repeat protein
LLCCNAEWDEDEVRRAADLGDAFAQAELAWRTIGQERFRWAEKSAAQGERDGLFWLGFCFHRGSGCVKDLKKAKESYLFAAELDHVSAMFCFGELLGKDEPQRFVCLEELLQTGCLIPS